ncbi:MAG TPA: hypothetical protein VKU01_17640 [Bryobacteraceae bacterium]|nr:hypothetical protein [Bryobacteraceae bacterium]
MNIRERKGREPAAPHRISACDKAERVAVRFARFNKMRRGSWLGFALIGALGLNLYAVETRFWHQNDQGDFEKGSLQNVSLRSDGHLFLAPSSRELFDSSTPYLWTAACDSAGNVFTAGGGTGNGKSKLFEISRDGKSKTLAELDGLEIHSIAVDKHDQIYAATAPDGQVYKVAHDGKAQPFFNPKAKYIWGMSFDNDGNLYIATGDQGEIFRVTPDGKGSVFFKTEETHARSLAIDSAGNLIVGTEPGGLILRITPTGMGFVLYQAPKREITAVAIAKDGTIYASGVGSRSSLPVLPTAAPLTPSPIANPALATQPAGRPVGAPTPASLAPAALTGGSELYRVSPDGSPRKVWSNSQDIVYALAFDREGRPLIGTGNRGHIYRLDSNVASMLLLALPPTQITSFCNNHAGELYAITGNIGKVYQIGPGLASSGSFESEPLDAGEFSYWGRIRLQGATSGVTLESRTGNLNRPVNNWSPWQSVALSSSGDGLTGRISSPSARFLQYKITLASSPRTPEISEVEIAYLTKNVAPVVEQIEITPANYKFPTNSLTLTPSTTLTLPPIGQHKSTSSSIEVGSSASLTYSKGYVGVRWASEDDNGDGLCYKIEIRGKGESAWKLLKDDLRERTYSWDSTAFPDGEYEVRITASDAPSNPPGEALTASLVSDPFLIDNTPPQISGLSATSSPSGIDVKWHAHDARSIIDHAEYSVNGGEWLVAVPVTKLSDSPDEDYHFMVQRTATGEQTIAVRVADEYDNQAVDKVVVK